jgi:hypothetical protein
MSKESDPVECLRHVVTYLKADHASKEEQDAFRQRLGVLRSAVDDVEAAILPWFPKDRHDAVQRCMRSFYDQDQKKKEEAESESESEEEEEEEEEEEQAIIKGAYEAVRELLCFDAWGPAQRQRKQNMADAVYAMFEDLDGYCNDWTRRSQAEQWFEECIIPHAEDDDDKDLMREFYKSPDYRKYPVKDSEEEEEEAEPVKKRQK